MTLEKQLRDACSVLSNQIVSYDSAGRAFDDAQENLDYPYDRNAKDGNERPIRLSDEEHRKRKAIVRTTLVAFREAGANVEESVKSIRAQLDTYLSAVKPSDRQVTAISSFRDELRRIANHYHSGGLDTEGAWTPCELDIISHQGFLDVIHVLRSPTSANRPQDDPSDLMPQARAAEIKSDLITQEDAATQAGVSSKCIRDWIDQGKLPSHGPIRRVSKSELDELLPMIRQRKPRTKNKSRKKTRT